MVEFTRDRDQIQLENSQFQLEVCLVGCEKVVVLASVRDFH